MEKMVYSYAPATGEYSGITVADESPLEPGVYLLPAHSTQVPPPEAGDHEAAVWDGGMWVVVPDWRGTTWYDKATGEEIAVTELGISPPVNGVDVPPPDGEHIWEGGAWVLPLETAKIRKLMEISTAHLAHVAGSVMTSLGFPMQFDTRDSLMVRGAVELLEATGGTEGYLTDAQNVNHPATLAEMRQVLMEMVSAFASAHAHKQTLRALAQAATTPEELNAINLSFEQGE